MDGAPKCFPAGGVAVATTDDADADADSPPTVMSAAEGEEADDVDVSTEEGFWGSMRKTRSFSGDCAVAA